jgi:hypothetical protein
MALPKKIPVKQMLKLVSQLSPKELEEFMREIKLQELRDDIQISLDELDRGEGIPGEQVFSELKSHLIQKGKNKK